MLGACGVFGVANRCMVTVQNDAAPDPEERLATPRLLLCYVPTALELLPALYLFCKTNLFFTACFTCSAAPRLRRSCARAQLPY